MPMTAASVAVRDSAGGVGRKAMAYRPDVDGLRAFSILAVVIYHAFPRWMPGGFIGVDVFFVISGYLITGIVLGALQEGRFRYGSFYRRRIRRLFPALLVVLVTFLAVGWLLMVNEEWKLLAKHVVCGAMFTSNLVLLTEGGYFDATVKPLRHLWSLGVEEQFYIVWPMLLVLVWRRRWVLPAMAAVGVVSFGMGLWSVERMPYVAFYFPAMRIWELALGAVLAHLMLSEEGAGWVAGRWMAEALSWTGAVLLAAGLVWIREERAFPGVWALLPTLGAACVIAAGPEAWVSRTLLSNGGMVWLGLISYPLYLWHYPLLVFAEPWEMDRRGWLVTLAVMGAAVSLSYLTYRFVEKPLRYPRDGVRVANALAGAMGVVAVAGLVFHYGKVPTRLEATKDLRAYYAAKADWDYPFAWNGHKAGGFRVGRLEGPGPGEVLFIGDSHAEQYYDRVKYYAESHRGKMPSVLFATSEGCPPLPHLNKYAAGYACNAFFDWAMQLAMRREVTTVVFSGFWETYFGYRVNGKGAATVYSTRAGRGGRLSSFELARRAIEEFGGEVRRLRASGKKVFVILSNPASRLYSPDILLNRITGRIAERDLERTALEVRQPVLGPLADEAGRAGAVVIDPVSSLCGAEVCRTVGADGTPLDRDSNHIRATTARKMATFVDRVFEE